MRGQRIEETERAWILKTHFDMERLLTIDELCALLRVRKTTIYSWVYKKRIPFVKPSNRVLRFRENEILRWMEERSFVPVKKVVHLQCLQMNE